MLNNANDSRPSTPEEDVENRKARSEYKLSLASQPDQPYVACYVFPTLVFSVVAVTSLWFAPNAIAQETSFSESEVSILTTLVQTGFTAGTFLSSYFALADRIDTGVLFFGSALCGAVFNALCLSTHTFAAWAAFRFFVGYFLATVYPVGLKITARTYPSAAKLGSKIGWIVGARTLGTSLPWFIRAITPESVDSISGDGEGIVVLTLSIISIMAVIGGVLVLFMFGFSCPRLFRCFNTTQEDPELEVNSETESVKSDGLSSEAESNGTDPKKVQVGFKVMKEIWLHSSDFRVACIGYWCHNFEQYALWAYVPYLQAEHEVYYGTSILSQAWTVFIVIGAGAVSTVLAGYWSHFAGRGIFPGSAIVGFSSLSVSGICCALVPAYKLMSPAVFLFYLIVWGASVAADSAQFSSLVASYAPKKYIGTALTINNCIGYMCTIVALQVVGVAINRGVDPGWALFIVFPFPVIGAIIGYYKYPFHRLICMSPSMDEVTAESV